MNIKALLILCCFSTTAFSQSITNGNFSSSSSGWGCNPETNPESVYGGSGTNRVAEIDASAGRCQTVTGFTVGHIYTLSFQVSRRTNCGPTLQSMSVTMNNGALDTSVSRDGTAFSLAAESFTFTATSTSHILTFAGTTAGTCGLLLDNVQIAFTALPVSLISFEGSRSNDQTIFSWSTASELNNDFFSLEKSNDGKVWEHLAYAEGSGTTHSQKNYTYETTSATKEIFFRLSQTDFDGKYELLKTIKIESEATSLDIFPNPATTSLNVRVNEDLLATEAKIVNQWGQEELTLSQLEFMGVQDIDISGLKNGIYYLRVGDTTQVFVKH